MKKIFILLALSFLLAGCDYIGDPLFPIKRMARSNKIDKKAEAGLYYDKAVKILTDAYKLNASLNKDVGKKLMFQGNFSNALKHLEIARDMKSEDSDIYYWMGICYVNLYKINKSSLNLNITQEERDKIEFYLTEAEKNYLASINLAPSFKEVYYSYAHLLVYAKVDYEKAKVILHKYLYEINPKMDVPDVKAMFLLGHVYYALEDYKSAYETYDRIYQFKKSLDKSDLLKLDQYIQDTGKQIEDNKTN
ncbi:MAG: hypothetical protein JXB50_09570 [Spirochaetes bacterium]|nr:hypothetical protein [Spirochaetota bacterium]